MKCPNCGKEISEENAVCPHCGALIDEPCYDIEDDLESEEDV